MQPRGGPQGMFVPAGMSLPNRCLAINVYSDFTIPLCGRYANIYAHLQSFLYFDKPTANI
jgi:hypothetical protein